MSDSLIDLICDKCGCNYQKPEIFKQYLVATNGLRLCAVADLKHKT